MVGIVAASQDVELAGPQALSADGQGNLFVLDQINGRILQFDPKQPNTAPDILKMPGDVQPTDLVVHNDDIMVWDGGVRMLKAAPGQSTRGLGGDVIQLEEVSSRGTDDQVAISAFAQMGSQALSSPTDLLDQDTRAAIVRTTRQPDRQYIASRSKGSVIADIIPDKGNAGVRVEIQTMVSNETIGQLGLRVRNQLGTVEFLEIDNSDRFYVLAEDIPPSGKNASTFVARYAANGRLEGIYELPLENTPVTRRFVTVSGDGDVYFLRTKPDGVEVVGVGFRPLGKVSVIDVRPSRTAAAPAAARPDIKFNATAAVRPSNRQQAIETAFAFEGIQWKLTPANYGSDPDSQCSGFSRIRRAVVSAGQGKPGSARRALLLGLPRFAREFPAADRQRDAGGQCLHPQRATAGCGRCRLFGIRQRRVGAFRPLHDRRHPRDRRARDQPLGPQAW
ncbi:hypothetical protein [Bradyrhizobium elkanii]|uniref:hypothetical protein n=1 Tax=Bradyrhizobium elkanii TaxID=29448 RepID=UPI0035167766